MRQILFTIAVALLFLSSCGQKPQSIKAEQKPTATAEPRQTANPSLSTARTIPEDVMPGVRLYNQGKYEEARTSLEQTISSGSVNWQAFYYLGLTCRMLKQYERSRSSFQQALTFAPNDQFLRSDLYASLAEVSELIGDARQALLQYHMAVNLNPDNMTAHDGVDRLSQHSSR